MAEELTPEEARRRIEELVKENRTLSETLEGLDTDVKTLEKLGRAAVEARQKAEEEAAEARRTIEELQREVAELQNIKGQLEPQVRRLSKQVEKVPLHPLAPEEASVLFDRTLQAFRSIRGFEVRTVDLTLKLATAKLGDELVLVLPEPGEVDPASLHEVKIGLRGGAMTLARAPQELEGPVPREGIAVPNVIGQTLGEATRLLRTQGWRFEAHAVSEEEITAAREALPGHVLRQDPVGGVRVDKVTTVVHFWVALSTLPAKEIDGIGDKRAARLAEIGITTVGEFSLAGAPQIAATLGVRESLAQDFIAMATFISQLTIVNLTDEVVEVLVKGAKVSSMDELASADATQLYRSSLEAVESGRVRVPERFTFTSDDVQGWIRSAQSYLREKGENS